MADLYELLAPYFDVPDRPSSSFSRPAPNDPQIRSYLTRLSNLSLSDLTSTESVSLLQSAQCHLRSLQALSKRSHKAVIASSIHLANLASLLPILNTQAKGLNGCVPELEAAASDFTRKYDRSTENAVLDRWKRAMLLSRNVDRLSDVLELPSLLSSTVSAAQIGSTASTSSAATSYASALDLHAHIRRLRSLYPQSDLVGNISKLGEIEIENLSTILITTLQSPSLKLAAAMRTVGWLRRVAPDLAGDGFSSRRAATLRRSFSLSRNVANEDGALGLLFLICRLRMLNTIMKALEPLRELADQEIARRQQATNGIMTKQEAHTSTLGSQSERYLKRYIEIFREQSFGIVSMYKSIFPTGLPIPDASVENDASHSNDPRFPIPSPVSSFALHLVNMLTSTLRAYMPNTTDKSARLSILTQVLYCAGSLGRLGADFGMLLSFLEAEAAAEHAMAKAAEDGEDPEWVQVMKKHRVQASRLEVLARGVGGVRKVSNIEVQSPTAG